MSFDCPHNQCLALQALAILRLRTTGQGLTIYQRAAQHILPALFDDTPPGYLPKVIVDEDLSRQEQGGDTPMTDQPERVELVITIDGPVQCRWVSCPNGHNIGSPALELLELVKFLKGAVHEPWVEPYVNDQLKRLFGEET